MSSIVQTVDLKDQYLQIKEEIDNALLSAVLQAAYINGPNVREFAEKLKEFNGVNYAITCGNGTDALQIAMMGLGFKPGDEIIVPAFTYVATVEVIALLGLVPRFVDVREDTFEVDHELLEMAITEKTVGIVPVHLFGQCANMDAIKTIGNKYKLAVIEDTAQSLGAEFIRKDGSRAFAGTIGDAGTLSFFPSKNLGCFGDGGALLTNNAELASKMRMIANHGQKQKYLHECVGINSRLDTLQATILNVKIKYLNEYTKARQRAAEIYDNELRAISFITTPRRAEYSTHVFNQYTCKVKHGKRDELRSFLSERGIQTAIYYPRPLHLQPAYTCYGYKAGDFPVAENLCNEVISLPMYPEITLGLQKMVTDAIVEFFEDKSYE